MIYIRFKLYAFQCPYKYLTNGIFQSEIWNTVKTRNRSENFNFQGVGIALIGGGQKSFSFKEEDLP